MQKVVETRLSNGFEAMEPGEATWAVLAGMGGELMKTILQNGKAHLDAGIGLIFTASVRAAGGQIVSAGRAVHNYR